MFFAIRYFFFLHKIGHSIETSTIRRVFLIQASSCSFSGSSCFTVLVVIVLLKLQNKESTKH